MTSVFALATGPDIVCPDQAARRGARAGCA